MFSFHGLSKFQDSGLNSNLSHTKLASSLYETLLCELLPYLDQNITLSFNKIIYIKKEAYLIKQLAHGCGKILYEIILNFLNEVNDTGNFRPGKFIIKHENQCNSQWNTTWQ